MHNTEETDTVNSTETNTANNAEEMKHANPTVDSGTATDSDEEVEDFIHNVLSASGEDAGDDTPEPSEKSGAFIGGLSGAFAGGVAGIVLGGITGAMTSSEGVFSGGFKGMCTGFLAGASIGGIAGALVERKPKKKSFDYWGEDDDCITFDKSPEPEATT